MSATWMNEYLASDPANSGQLLASIKPFADWVGDADPESVTADKMYELLGSWGASYGNDYVVQCLPGIRALYAHLIRNGAEVDPRMMTVLSASGDWGQVTPSPSPTPQQPVAYSDSQSQHWFNGLARATKSSTWLAAAAIAALVELVFRLAVVRPFAEQAAQLVGIVGTGAFASGLDATPEISGLAGVLQYSVLVLGLVGSVPVWGMAIAWGTNIASRDDGDERPVDVRRVVRVGMSFVLTAVVWTLPLILLAAATAWTIRGMLVSMGGGAVVLSGIVALAATIGVIAIGLLLPVVLSMLATGERLPLVLGPVRMLRTASSGFGYWRLTGGSLVLVLVYRLANAMAGDGIASSVFDPIASFLLIFLMGSLVGAAASRLRPSGVRQTGSGTTSNHDACVEPSRDMTTNSHDRAPDPPRDVTDDRTTEGTSRQRTAIVVVVVVVGLLAAILWTAWSRPQTRGASSSSEDTSAPRKEARVADTAAVDEPAADELEAIVVQPVEDGPFSPEDAVAVNVPSLTSLTGAEIKKLLASNESDYLNVYGSYEAKDTAGQPYLMHIKGEDGLPVRDAELPTTITVYVAMDATPAEESASVAQWLGFSDELANRIDEGLGDVGRYEHDGRLYNVTVQEGGSMTMKIDAYSFEELDLSRELRIKLELDPDAEYSEGALGR